MTAQRPQVADGGRVSLRVPTRLPLRSDDTRPDVLSAVHKVCGQLS
jgi:hypothetical protein